MNELKAESESTRREKQVMERRRRLRMQGMVAGGHFEVVEVVKLVGVFQLLEYHIHMLLHSLV